jgi:hypothetical protein
MLALPTASMRRKSLAIACFIVAISLIAASVFIWQRWQRQHWLSIAPAQFHITQILYNKTQSWGIGPGGHATGVVVYELPVAIAQQLSGDAAAVLNAPNALYDWKPTPLHGYSEWTHTAGAPPQSGPQPAPRLDNYLNQYGFGISIEPHTANAIDQAISTAGNFYAHTRTGMLLVMPAQRRLVLMYAG